MIYNKLIANETILSNLSTNSTSNMNILHVIVIFSMISYLTADKAVAVLKPSNSTVQGVIRFEDNSGETVVLVNITGLYPKVQYILLG